VHPTLLLEKERKGTNRCHMEFRENGFTWILLNWLDGTLFRCLEWLLKTFKVKKDSSFVKYFNWHIIP
jgi:hypothetical protein